MTRFGRGANQLQTFALLSEFIAEPGVCNANHFQGSLSGGFAAQLRRAEFSDDAVDIVLTGGDVGAGAERQNDARDAVVLGQGLQHD